MYVNAVQIKFYAIFKINQIFTGGSVNECILLVHEAKKQTISSSRDLLIQAGIS